MCFVADPMKRSTFSDIVQELEKELSNDEQLEYKRQSEQYISKRSLVSNPETSQFTGNSTLKRHLLNVGNDEDTKDKNGDKPYLDMTPNINPKKSQIETQNTQIQPEQNHPNIKSKSDNENGHTPYVFLSGVNTSPGTPEDNCDKFKSNMIGCDKSNNFNTAIIHPDSNQVISANNGYITIETANC